MEGSFLHCIIQKIGEHICDRGYGVVVERQGKRAGAWGSGYSTLQTRFTEMISVLFPVTLLSKASFLPLQAVEDGPTPRRNRYLETCKLDILPLSATSVSESFYSSSANIEINTASRSHKRPRDLDP